MPTLAPSYKPQRSRSRCSKHDRAEKVPKRRMKVSALRWCYPQRLADAQRRGAACFDRAFYVSSNFFDLGFIEQQPDPQVRTTFSCSACFLGL